MRSRITRTLTNCQSKKIIIKFNSSINELNKKMLFMNNVIIHQFILCNFVFAFYIVYN
jgi:hypothetical protein